MLIVALPSIVIKQLPMLEFLAWDQPGEPLWLVISSQGKLLFIEILVEFLDSKIKDAVSFSS